MSKFHLLTVDCDGAIETFRGENFAQAAAEFISCAQVGDDVMYPLTKALSCLSKIAYAIDEADENGDELTEFTTKDWDMMDSVEVTWRLTDNPEQYEEICPHTGMTRTECECVFGCHDDGDLVLLPEPEALDNPHNDTITSVRESIQYGDCTVYGVINGEERKLFSYYIDELSINANDLIGMTSAEAIEHKRNADVAYLRS